MENIDSGAEEQIGKPKQEGVGVDWFLQLLVRWTNQGQLLYPITLLVDGLLVSGYLAEAKEYFDAMQEEWDQAIHGQTKKVSLFREIGETVREAQEAAAETFAPLPQFIHLKEARIFHPAGSPVPTNRMIWWRGRITEVDGFFLGTLSG